MAYRRAMDTFVAEIDGIPYGVTKGAVLPESHPAVRHDMANGGVNFEVLDTGGDEKPPEKSTPAKADPAPKAAPAKPGKEPS
jgi:hypothetical protein